MTDKEPIGTVDWPDHVVAFVDEDELLASTNPDDVVGTIMGDVQVADLEADEYLVYGNGGDYMLLRAPTRSALLVEVDAAMRRHGYEPDGYWATELSPDGTACHERPFVRVADVEWPDLGVPVVDATEPLDIIVTAEDIEGTISPN